MINYGKVKGATRPKEIDITATSVFIASNIEFYTEVIEGESIQGYEYDYVEYDKDEYIQLLYSQSKQLAEELAAAKILLGVE